jgi:hypothetical protein
MPESSFVVCIVIVVRRGTLNIDTMLLALGSVSAGLRLYLIVSVYS